VKTAESVPVSRGNRTLQPVPRWAVITTFSLSLVGLAISTYLTITHFQAHLMVCSIGGIFNCILVTTSPQSHFLGVPVAILGLINFVVMTVINSPWGWRSKIYMVHVARFALAIFGMAFVLWLVSAELLIIKSFCLYCTGVHVVTFALLVVLTQVSPTQLGWSRSVQNE
jgi:uncharacterized membrane protein